VSIPPFLHLPNGVSARTIRTTRGEFAALDNKGAIAAGNGPDPAGYALLIPGFTGSKEDFIAILAPLAAAGKHAIAIDLTGQYESVGPADAAPYSLGGFAADVLAIIAELDGPADLVAHSMGGLVAREVVLADPLAASSLVLMDSGPGALPPAHHQRMQLFAQVLAMQGLEMVWSAKQALEEQEGITAPTDPEIAQFLTDRFLANSPGSLISMVDLLCTAADRTDELAAVAPRTLVCFGDRDDVWSPAEQRAMGEALGSRIVEFPDTGHSPAGERPPETAAALLSFWASDK